jgi:hypothetical protein
VTHIGGTALVTAKCNPSAYRGSWVEKNREGNERPTMGKYRASQSNIVWHKIRKDGGSDGRGVGFYFRNVTDPLRGPREEREDAPAGADPGELHFVSQARTLAEA